MATRVALAAVLAVAAGQAATFQGKCLLEVNGRAYIKGPCNVEMRQGGDFTIGTGRTPITYFAYVYVNGETAEGFWNEERGANHAHTSLGTFTRDGACWSNQTAKVCAWR
jgi:hypothetical protein